MQVSIKVVAGAKKEGIESLPNSRFKISVKQKPAQGAANKRVVELIAAHFKIPVKKIHIIRGHKTPSKLLEIGGK